MFSKKLQRKINRAAKQDFKCFYCRKPMLIDPTGEFQGNPSTMTWEHLIAKKNPDWQNNQDFNLVVCCKGCNEERGRTWLNWEEFAVFKSRCA
jgi:5-methylcytosine-specific restriction endonuclease McrA